MDEMLDIDELLALHEDGDKAEGMEQEDQDLDVLREWEAEMEAKENRVKKCLFQEQSEVTIELEKESLKRNRELLDTSQPLEELSADLSNSPIQKRMRITNMTDDLRSTIRNAANRKVFRRIPNGPFQSVTLTSGERYYVAMKDQTEEEAPVKTTKHAHGLCGVPYSTLLDQAFIEQSRMSDVKYNINDQDIIDQESDGGDITETLWSEKFRPRSFIHLLSDDGTNRTLLHWLKLWDKVVFNRERKPRAKRQEEEKKEEEQGKKKKFKKDNEITLDLPTELDDYNRPLQKVALLHGPPGLGKTTLAHVIANHAGYNVVEMNASDDRSLSLFKNRLQAATQMKSVNAKDQRPNCLIIDEIDGAPIQTINHLVSLITGKSSGKKGKKNAEILQRPIICICNDLYVPALRSLKQLCMVLPFPPTLSARLSKRLMEIIKKEGLQADLSTLMALCEKTDNDIRSCLSTLQFFKSRGKSELTPIDVQRANVGQKDNQKSHFAVWKELFQIPRGTAKTFKQVGNRSVVVDENVSTSQHRFHKVLSAVQSCGEYEKMANGVFENYLDIKFKDSQLKNVIQGLDWMSFCDLTQSYIHRSQNYAVMAYLPFTFVKTHLLFATHAKSRITYPYTATEKNNLLNRNQQLLMSMMTEMPPVNRMYVDISSLVRDILPFLLEIVQPNLRPVNTQLYSAREKEELKNLVSTMLAFNLTYHQVRNNEGQFDYKLEPALHEVAWFTNDHKGLSYGLKQLIAREIDVEAMRHDGGGQVSTSSKAESAASGRKPNDLSVSTADAAIKQDTPSHLQKLQAKKVDVKPEKRPVDFFGRKIDPALLKKRDEEKKQEKNDIVSSDIWFKFKEGYNNAVRKNIRMKDLF